jgi:arylsulfatase A-like enzyme
MLTGAIPPHHGKHKNADVFFDPSHVTLAQLLKTKGYTTGAFVAAQVLSRSFGLDRGFDNYGDKFANDGHERRAEDVNREAFDWLDRQAKDAPVFMFLHYYDAHDPYAPPEPFATTFQEDPYAGEIAYADKCIGDVVAKLKSLGMYDSTLIVVTGDHGEMLGEHGEATHMYFIYQSALKIPLVFKPPGSRTGQQIEDLASIIDIVPTVCALLGIDTPAGIEGKNLAGYFGQEPPLPEDRYLYCESMHPTHYGANSLVGLTSNEWKYIRTTRPELYDLQNDPGEENNLFEVQSRQAGILNENLTQISELATSQGGIQKDAPLDPDLLHHLRSLGYVGESSAQEDTTFEPNKEDPKDLIDYHNAWCKAEHLVIDNKLADALTVIEAPWNSAPIMSCASWRHESA